MPIGDSIFTADELEADRKREEESKKEHAEKMANGFFKNGGVRNIIIVHIGREEKISQKGNNYVLHTYSLEDVDTKQEEVLVDRDFAFTNALSPIKKALGLELRLGMTVLKLTTTLKGTREFNGIEYPQWSHTLEMVANPHPQMPTGSAKDDNPKIEEVPF